MDRDSAAGSDSFRWKTAIRSWNRGRALPSMSVRNDSQRPAPVSPHLGVSRVAGLNECGATKWFVE